MCSRIGVKEEISYKLQAASCKLKADLLEACHLQLAAASLLPLPLLAYSLLLLL
jgi:hypothetical protein